MTASRPLARPCACLLAALVLALTLAAVSRGSASIIRTGASHSQINFDLLGGASQAFSLPESNTPVMLSGSNITAWEHGCASVVITHHTSGITTWSGINAEGSPTSGSSGSAGTEVVGIGHFDSPVVELQNVAAGNNNASRQLRVRNDRLVVRATGNIQMIW
jgi:hypothetical protein